MSLTLTKAQQAGLTRAQRDPAGWIRAFLGADLWEKQIEIAESVRDNRRTAVKSCHGSGKSFLAARLVIWYLNTHPNAVVVTTAPTYNQVVNILWRSIRTAHDTAIRPLLGRCLTDRYDIAPEWYAIGRKAADTAPDAFQGFHAVHTFLVKDEAAGLAEPVHDALDAMMSSEHARELQIGNPTNPEGTFHAAFHGNRSRYHCITISAEDTPNFTEGRTVRPYLITPAWADDVIAKHGQDSPYVQARVFARFPTVGDRNLIPLAWIERAHHEEIEPDNSSAVAGLDCARGGADENAICIRRGIQVVHQEAWSGIDLMETVGKVRGILARYPDLARINIDAEGIGAGVYDRLRELKKAKQITYEPVEVRAGREASRPNDWANLRCELWWKLKERFREGLIVGPFDEISQGQMSSVKFTYRSSHTYPWIESKEEMKRRGLRSPDRAEAIMMAFADIGRSEGRYRVSELTAPAQTQRPNDPRERDRRDDMRGGRGGSLAGSRSQTF